MFFSLVKQIIKGILNDIRFTDLLPKAMQTIERLSYLHSFQFAPSKSATLEEE